MTEATLVRAENVKVLRNEERVRISGRTMTSTEAKELGLPGNCVVMPMRILKRPEVISRRKT